ncbi:unnamed protein product [Dibothriocephalus latus]|uniref:Uncharacterized protein n=1 Tax=Dibothriocephalus latus TaxID=60516 RepID=A0A3P6PKF2_DIBLA|nr:unnamed protein product [Dibothriocephalus latus]
MPKKLKTSVRCLADSQPLLVKSATGAYVESIVQSLCKEGYGVGDNTYQATFSGNSGKFNPTTKQTPKLTELKWKKVEQFKIVSRDQDCVFIVHNTNKYMILRMDNAGEAKKLQALVLKANPNVQLIEDRGDGETSDDIGSVAPAKVDKTKQETKSNEVSPPKDHSSSAPKSLPRSVPKSGPSSHRQPAKSYNEFPRSRYEETKGNENTSELSFSEEYQHSAPRRGPRSLPRSIPKSAQSSHRPPSQSRKEPPRSRAMKTSTVQWDGYRTWRGRSQMPSRVEEDGLMPRCYYQYKPRASSETRGRRGQGDRTYDHWRRSPSPYARDWSPPRSRYDSNIHVESYSPVDEDSFSSSRSSSPGSMQLGRITCTPVPKGRQTWYKPDIYYHNKMPKVVREGTTYAEYAESDDSTRTPSERTIRIMELIGQKETPKHRNSRV